MKRRKFIEGVGLGSAALLTNKSVLAKPVNSPEIRKGNINHSVCKWCFNDIPLDEFAAYVKTIGIKAIDLCGPKDWPTLKKNEVHSSMCNGAEINLIDGWNEKDNHKTLIKNYKEMIPLVGKAGYTNLICFSGNRRGISDAEGMDNCIKGLKKILKSAEKHKVVIQMELFNSKIDHPDYMCDNTAWGIELCKRLDSPNFKLLYDIYHMQINEGDIIRTIQEHHQYFGHYHTAGVPGRNEINDSQELNYPAIMRAIADTGFQGYVAQEFIPTTENKLSSLEEAINICDI